MKKNILIIFIVAALGMFTDAQLVKSVTLDGRGKVEGAGVEEIAAEGAGSNEREAVEDAFRNAIEKSIGLYVDNETKIQNDQLISDKILTSSKGYVDNYRILSKKEEGGLTKVEIKALIKMEDVKSKLTGLNISIIAAEDSANIHARLSTKLKRSKDAEEILIKEFTDFFQEKNLLNLLEIKLKEYKIYEKDIAQDNTVPFDVTFEVSININNYNKIIEDLSKVFINIGGNVRKQLKVEITKNDIETFSINQSQFNRYNEIIKKEWKENVKNVCFGLVYKENNTYILDHYCFPDEWKTIYPWNEQRRNELIKYCENCGDEMVLKNLEVVIQFKNTGSVIYEKIPKYNYSGLDVGFLEILKATWPCFGQSSICRGWGSNYEDSNSMSAFNIGPFIKMKRNFYMSPALLLTYKDRINVDLLYDLKNVEVELRMKEQ